MKRRRLIWLTSGLLVVAVLMASGCTVAGRRGPSGLPQTTAELLPNAAVGDPAQSTANSQGVSALHTPCEDANRATALSPDDPDALVPLPLLDGDPPDDRVALTSSAEGDETLVHVALAQPSELLPPTEAVSAAAPDFNLNVIPIDFGGALAIASGQNPQVAFARQRINEALAQARAAEVLWVPSLRAGTNYNKHEGTIQDVAGNIIETSRGSIYTGLGAQAVGAGSPAVPGVVMNFHTKDLIFQPRIAEQVLGASRQASRATTNDILMEAALAYNDLLEALQLQVIAAETLDNTRRLADVTGQYARTGQGLPSDADRAQAELATRQIEAQRATENVQVATVRLARLLSQDPAVTLAPQEPSLVPIDLAPTHCSLQELVATSLSTRPELAESRFLVGAAVQRLRREQNAPLIPSVLLGLSYGGNGGGLGSDIGNFGDRLDFDAVAYWELRNLGLGEQAARNEARSRLEQARWRQVQVMDQVASDVAEAYAQVVSRRQQIELAQSGITAARESYRRNSERVQDALGLPIEALQSIQALDGAQRQYVRSVADYNRAQFRLQRALGWPIQ